MQPFSENEFNFTRSDGIKYGHITLENDVTKNKKKKDHQQNTEETLDDDLWVTPEQSMFHTRIPRPTYLVAHLVFAFFMFLTALSIAIFYAKP